MSDKKRKIEETNERDDRNQVETRDQEEFKAPTTSQQVALWEGLIREVLFKVPCTTIFQCHTSTGEYILTFDHQKDQNTFITMNGFTLPSDLWLVLHLVKTIIHHFSFKSVIMTGRKVNHPGLPTPQAEDGDSRFYYHFP